MHFKAGQFDNHEGGAMKLKITLLVGALLLMTSPVWASTITFNFGSCGSISSIIPGTCPGNLGTDTATYTSGGLSVTATGYLNTSTTNNLFVKSDGAEETGLGLAGTADDEIGVGQYIYLDMSDLLSHGIDHGTLWLGSAQVGEDAMVCETSAVGTPGKTDCLTAIGNSSGLTSLAVDWTSGDPILSITAFGNSSNVLVAKAITASPVPEPSSMALFGTMLLAFAFAYHRLRSSTAVS
jgi:hypothetical protein